MNYILERKDLMPNPLLDVQGLGKSFALGKGKRKTVLENIEFMLYPKETLTIMGPSGGGKSTFLKILAGILSYDSGNIFFHGEDIKKNLGYYTSQISFIFQEYRLIPHLNAFENVALALRLRGMKNWKKKALESLEFCRIEHLQNSYPGQLSGGESQRVGIARAIAVNPQIIFADEPTGNLDDHMAKEIMQVFEQIQKEFHTSFVIVTHDSSITKYAHRQYFLYQGVLSTKDPYEKE